MLAKFATETMTSWHGRKISPVYSLLQDLKEPDWHSLRTDEAKAFWATHKAWSERIEVARRGERPGDILVLAEEAPTRVLQLEAYRTAGKALVSLGQFDFALAQYENALALDPTDLESRRQKGVLLGRSTRPNRYDEAKVWLTAVVQDHPNDAESWALLGRIEKEAWTNTWLAEGKTVEQMREDAAYEESMLREAIKTYATGFRKDPRHYYSGINAITLLYLLKDLTGKDENVQERRAMEGGVRWAVESALAEPGNDYWEKVTLAELELLVSDPTVMENAYKDAVAVGRKDKDWFALDSSRRQLLLLKNLEFRPDAVEVALQVFDRALKQLKAPEVRWEPRLVFLFSGHMIDAPGRTEPRFPPEAEPIAANAIAEKLDELEAGPEDLAICGGACGGDLLFAEACLQRGLRLEMRIPFEEPKFLKESITFVGEGWRKRFYKVKDHKKTQLFVMPAALGPLPKRVDPYARHNLWQLYTALAWGPTKVRFICLWNRKEGDGPGGTKHMHDTVLQHSGQVYILNTTVLW
jgi:tetratricopeptide (TPR) repeat protein